MNTQPIIDWALRVAGVSPKLSLRRDDEGILWVGDGSDEIAIVHEARADRYLRGIKRRCRRIAEGYLGNDVARPTPGNVVVNVGANIGELAIYLAGLGAHVVAIEPDPSALLCLAKNAAGKSIEILPNGVWSVDGRLDFFLATDTADTSAINPTENQITIDAKRLDTIVREHGLQRIHLIVGDAEGAEPEVLAGAREALGITKFVSLDCGSERRGQSTYDTCAELLVSAGFQILHGARRKYLIGRNQAIAS